LTKMGSFEQAIGKYTEMVKHGDVNQDVITAIGLAGLRLPMLPKDVAPAKMEPISAAGQAAAAFMGGDLPGADRAFQNAFTQYPSVPNLHFFYGYLLFSADSDKAIDQFQKELSVSPDSAETHSMLAWAYGLRGDYTASLSDARQAVDENPNLTIAQLVLGRALVETGDMNAGVQHLLIVLAGDPQNLDAHLTLAKAYSKLGRKDEARHERLQCLAITGQGATTNATM
jgi:predicted Zn-dependent protease